MKGLVLAYNKDMQEDKEPLFDAHDTVLACTTLMSRLLADARFQPERMKRSLYGDFSTATDLADALASDGVPFREAHEIVGKLVRQCLERKQALETLTIEELKAVDARFTPAALLAVTPEASANARTSYGGTALSAVRDQIEEARQTIK
jgi:argininosuccinate lyase